MVTAMISTIAFGQVQSDIRTATLVHGDKTTVYYGVDALIQAYKDAAEEGDVIVLSSGYFNKINIQKSISIYGVGYETDTISGLAPTQINQLAISPNTSTDENGTSTDSYPIVHLEGLYLKATDTNGSADSGLRIQPSDNNGILTDFTMKKCRINGNFPIQTATKNCSIRQCVLKNIQGEFVSVTSGYGGSYYKNNLPEGQQQLNIENCWIDKATGTIETDNNILYNHCIIRDVSTGIAHYNNCILKDFLPDNCTANYNIFTTKTIGSNITGIENYVDVPVELIFADPNENGSYSATAKFDILDADLRKGTDGTEIGINGGLYPFDRIPSTPRILESNIDLETTSDGKLNVSLKVQAQSK